MERLAIVTGTSRGLGAAIARELLERDWDVWGVARGEAPADLDGPRYVHQRLDLGDLARLRDWVEDALGRDLAGVRRVGVVNNAGTVQPVAPLHEADLEAVHGALVVNALAPTWLTARVLARFPSVPVRVVDVSSGAATSPYPGWGAYCASKAALDMFGRVLATEVQETPALADRDVRVVSYSPHVVATRMQEEVRASDPAAFPRRARFEALHAEGELIAPEGPAAEIATLLEADDLPPHSTLRHQP